MSITIYCVVEVNVKKHGIFQKSTVIDDKFEVLFFLGISDCCEVYRVKDRSSELKFLKLIKTDMVDSLELNQLKSALVTASNLAHPHLVQIHTLQSVTYNDEIHHYYLSDFISGETLGDLLRRKVTLNLNEALQLVFDILSALEYLHNEPVPVIHRNINPDSIYISYAEGEINALLIPVRVSDFAISSQRLPMQKKMDLAYVSPEGLEGKFVPASDIFSLITILYRCIVGSQPWSYEFDWQKNTVDFIRARVKLIRESTAHIKLSFQSDAFSEVLDSIISKGLQINPNDRYQNSQELLVDLRNYAKQESFNFKKILSPQITQNNDRKKKGLALIAGMELLKNQLKQDIIRPLREKELYQKYGIHPINGMLLYGPPGCGKTFIAQQLADEIDYFYIEIKPSDLASVYIHGTQEKIGRLFKEAYAKAPTLIFIDEVDAILPRRDSQNMNIGQAGEVNEFLAQMTNCGEKGVFIVAATNRPEIIDQAILRTGRLDKLVYVGIPDFQARKEMLELFLEGRPTAIKLDTHRLAIITTGLVSSDLKFLVNEVAKLALNTREPIEDRHFDEILSKLSSSVTQDQIDQYESFKTRYSVI